MQKTKFRNYFVMSFPDILLSKLIVGLEIVVGFDIGFLLINIT